jgi:hypothetical protein
MCHAWRPSPKFLGLDGLQSRQRCSPSLSIPRDTLHTTIGAGEVVFALAAGVEC